MSAAITHLPAVPDRSPGDFSDEMIDTIRRTVAEGATDAEFEIFLHQCIRTGLDPLARQIYLIPTGGGKRTVQVSIDGQRLVAERTGNYDGQDGPFWCGVDGEWHDVWTSKEPPIAARVVVHHKDKQHPIAAVAHLSEYQGRGRWQTAPAQMLAKCAEALALRKAFPHELAGLYAAEEMGEHRTETKGPTTMATLVAQWAGLAPRAALAQIDHPGAEQRMLQRHSVNNVRNLPAPVLDAAIKKMTSMIEAAEAADVADQAHDAVLVDEETGETL